jgi:hypothetical protein
MGNACWCIGLAFFVASTMLLYRAHAQAAASRDRGALRAAAWLSAIPATILVGIAAMRAAPDGVLSLGLLGAGLLGLVSLAHCR